MELIENPVLAALNEKLADSKYNADELDPVETCSSSCDFQLKDHGNGWPFWATKDFDGTNDSGENPGMRIDTIYFNGKVILHHWSQKFPKKSREIESCTLERVDIRNLVPIDYKEYIRRTDKINQFKTDLFPEFDI